ncbi:MAG: tetratricopeptide repeat protein [Candidatus Protistobacter heckmanni]|nr:tetratricopeptide repeat protein [Candidatus Protistobacter heckmanni]
MPKPHQAEQVLLHLRYGNHDGAEKLLRAMLKSEPRNPDVLLMLGVVHSKKGAQADAVAWFRKAIAADARHRDAWHNLAIALSELGRDEEALQASGKLLELDPGNAQALLTRGVALQRLARPEEALQTYDQALALQPGFADAWINRGNTLKELRRFDEALQSHAKALELAPREAAAWLNRSLTLHAARRHAEAIEAAEKAVELRPDFAQAQWHLSLLRLQTGDYERGWQGYSWRWHYDTVNTRLRKFAQPLEGKRILVHAEQGLGDSLQFCRYVPLLAARGAQVIFETPPALQALMRTLDAPGLTVAADGEALPDFDLYCPLLSLPEAFGTRLETIPSAVPYLHAPEAAAAAWRETLSIPADGAAERAPRIGLC